MPEDGIASTYSYKNNCNCNSKSISNRKTFFANSRVPNLIWIWTKIVKRKVSKYALLDSQRRLLNASNLKMTPMCSVSFFPLLS